MKEPATLTEKQPVPQGPVRGQKPQQVLEGVDPSLAFRALFFTRQCHYRVEGPSVGNEVPLVSV